MDLRPRRATSQIGKSRRNGEAAMRVVRNWASQGARSRWLFVCTEIYPRVAPIWVSALPWMEELSMELSFTGLAKKGQNGLSWKMVRDGAAAAGNQAAQQQRPQPQQSHGVQQRIQKPRGNSAGRRQRQSQHQLFHQQFSGSKWLRAQGQRQPQHRMSAPKNARRQVEAISSPPPFPRRHLRHHSGCVTRQLHGSCHTHTSCVALGCAPTHTRERHLNF